MKILDYSEEDIPPDKAGLGSSGLTAQSSWGSALTSGESKLLLLTVFPRPLLPKPVSLACFKRNLHCLFVLRSKTGDFSRSQGFWDEWSSLKISVFINQRLLFTKPIS